MLTVIRLLSSAPISYIDEGERVEFRIGLRDKPVTLRWDWGTRGKYDAGLEEVLKKSVRTDFDAAAAESLLGIKPASPGVAAALKALPEAGVGALLAWAERGDDARKDAVAAALRAWGERWNGEHRFACVPRRRHIAQEITCRVEGVERAHQAVPAPRPACQVGCSWLFLCPGGAVPVGIASHRPRLERCRTTLVPVC